MSGKNEETLGIGDEGGRGKFLKVMVLQDQVGPDNQPVAIAESNLVFPGDCG